MFAQGFAHRVRIADLDQYSVHATTLNWALRADQLPGGAFSADFDVVQTPRVQLGVVTYGGAFAAVGRTPKGATTFALPLGEARSTVFNRRVLGDDALLVIPSGQEISFRMTGPVRAASIVVDAALVDRCAHALFGLSFDRIARRGDGIGLSSSGARTAVARMQAFLTLFDPLRGQRTPASSFDRRCEQLEALLVDDLLGDFVPPLPETGWSRRGRIVRDAEEHIRVHADRPVTIAELCTALRVPMRTLDAAFRDCTGASPKRFMLAIRLNGVRRKLTQAPDATTVTDAAADAGFYHFGRFSAEYRRLFGELPSETLRRSVGH